MGHMRSPALETFPVVPGELTLCRTNPHPAVKAVGLAVLVWSAGPIPQNVEAGEVEVRFPLPGLSLIHI